MITYTPREFDPVPDGIYYAKIDSVDSQKPNKFKTEADDPDYVIEIVMTIQEDEDGDTTFAKRKMWKNISPYSKQIFDYYNAALGESLIPSKDPVSFDEQKMVGQTVRLVIGHKTQKNGNIGNTIESVKAPAKAYKDKGAEEQSEPESATDKIDISDINFGDGPTG